MELNRLLEHKKVLKVIIQAWTFHLVYIIWASSRENLSLGFPTKRVSNQSPQLQRLARKFKFHLYQVNNVAS